MGDARPAPSKNRPAPRNKKRRTGRFLRTLQILFSILMMIAVPVAALIIAYGYGNGDSLQVDATNVFRDIAELLGI
jgi:hypothetical protein